MNMFWLLWGGGPFFGTCQVMVDIFWLVVGGGKWWRMAVSGGGYILAGGRCW